MKKFVILLIILLTSSSFAMAITDEDKINIEARIDEAYKYFYNNSENQARSRAKEYVKNKYFYKYLDCKNSCEVEWNKIRTKADKFSIFTDPETIQKEANQAYYTCVTNNCEEIKQVQMEECYRYIEKYIDIKNKRK